MNRNHPVIIISSPSGGGKGTIIERLLALDPRLALSISATTRQPRDDEQDGVDYHYLSVEEFRKQIKEGNMLEWEEVYPGKMYGTLRSEIEHLWQKGKVVIFEIDVNGAMNLMDEFESESLSIFIKPPSMDVLKERLWRRGSEDPKSLQDRLNRAEYELSFASKFDVTVINDDLDIAVQEVLHAIHTFLKT